MSTLNSLQQLLAKMVGFDTVNGSISNRPGAEAELAGFLEAHAAGVGFETKRLAVDDAGFDLLVSHRVSDDVPWLLFVSHLDTVSTDNMTIDPLDAVVRDGRMYGRGACDTKASGAAMLCALRDYAQRPDQPNNVSILYTVDEEIGKTGIKAFIDRHLDMLGWRPAGAIVGEPTDLQVVVAHNGIARWTIRTRGIAAHSADPSQGQSAISMMVKVVQAIEREYIPDLATSHPLTGKAQCSINVIHGGAQVNIVPESCTIELDRRVVPGEDADSVLPAVEEVLDGLRQADPKLNVSQDAPFTDPPLDPTGHDALIAFVTATLRDESLPAEPVGVPFGTEASNLAECGIPAVVLGPGNIAQAHTKDEWIALDHLERAVKLYLRLMCRPLGT